MRTGLFSLMAIAILAFGCKKDQTLNENQKKAEEFRTLVAGKSFRATSFRSDKPIDYITNDSEVKAETDLWSYVKPHIVDDSNIFTAPSTLKIAQNALKVSGNDSTVLNRSYAISADKKSVIVDFVDYEYKPLRYRLQDFSETQFTLYIEWNGAILSSRFTRVQD